MLVFAKARFLSPRPIGMAPHHRGKEIIMRYAATIAVLFTVLGVSASFGAPAAVETKLYFAPGSGDDIWCADLDGSNQVMLVTGLVWVRFLDVDADGGKIYWTDAVADKVQRANLNGTTVEDIATGANLVGIAVDKVNDKVYWADDGVVHRADLDGSNPEVVVGAVGAGAIAIDAVNEKIHWTTLFPPTIQRANLDGSSVETLVTASSDEAPRAIEIDPDGQKMYWSTASILTEPYAKLFRANVDGSSVEVLWVAPDNLASIDDMALDLSAGKIHWTELGGARSPFYRRANLNGTSVETLDPLDAHALEIAEVTIHLIPTVSTWGLVVMTILGVTGGTILFQRRSSVCNRMRCVR
jgi:hypothetical protein